MTISDYCIILKKIIDIQAQVGKICRNITKEFSIKLFNISKGEKWRLNPMKYIPPRKCRSFLR